MRRKTSSRSRCSSERSSRSSPTSSQPGLTPTGTLIDSSRVSAWLTRDGAGSETIPASMRALRPGLYHFDPDGKSLHVAVADTEDGRLTVVLDATSAEERVDRFAYTLFVALVRLRVATVIHRARRRRDRGRPDRRGDADDRALGARTSRCRPTGARRRGRLAHRNVQPLSRPRRRHGRARARVRRQPRPRDPHAADDDPYRRRADRPRGGPRAAAARSASSGSPRRSTRSSRRPSRRCRTAPAGSPASEAIDLREFLLAACAAMADRADARGLRIVVDVGAGASVSVDRQALLTVVRNLVRNAIEHAAPATLRDRAATGAPSSSPTTARGSRRRASRGSSSAPSATTASTPAPPRHARSRPRPGDRQAAVRPTGLARSRCDRRSNRAAAPRSRSNSAARIRRSADVRLAPRARFHASCTIGPRFATRRDLVSRA